MNLAHALVDLAYIMLCLGHVRLFRKNLEDWDPRKLDYCSSKFNSYLGRSGQLIQTRDEKDTISLFVDHIPSAITKVR